MYKIVLTHEVLPGKLPEMIAWIKKQDEARTKQNPQYKPFTRYITVFGSVHQVTIEFEVEQMPEEPLVYAEVAGDGQDEFLTFITPGRTTLHVLKQLDLS